MQVLSEARVALEDGARTALQPLVVLEKQASDLLAEVRRFGGRVSSDVQALAVRAHTSTADLHERTLETRSVVMGRTGPGARELEQALSVLQREEQTVVARIDAAAESQATMVSGFEAATDSISDELADVLTCLGNAREKVLSIVNSGTSLLNQVEAELGQLKLELFEKIQQLESAFSNTMETIKTAVNAFVEGIRTLVGQFAETIDAATSPIIAGADALNEKVTDLLTKATNLIDQIQNLVATVIGAIDKIPVSSLPEPMAKPTVTTITQISTQFSTQLSNGAKTASTQLRGITDQIGGTLEKAEATLAEQLDRALQPLLVQTEEIVKRIEQKQLEIARQVTQQLESISAQKDRLIESAQSGIDALTSPVLDRVSTYCVQLSQTATGAEQSARRTFDQCRPRVSQLATQSEGISRRIAESAQSFETMQASLLKRLAMLKTRARSAR